MARTGPAHQPDRFAVVDITAGETACMRLNQMMDRNSDCRFRLAVILDAVILVGFFAVIGIMAAKVR